MVNTLCTKLEPWEHTCLKAFKLLRKHDHQVHELYKHIITNDELIKGYQWNESNLNKELIDLNAKHTNKLEKNVERGYREGCLN